MGESPLFKMEIIMNFETKVIFVVAIIGIIAVIFSNDAADNRCIEKGGQIIRNSAKLNHGCIMPVGVK